MTLTGSAAMLLVFDSKNALSRAARLRSITRAGLTFTHFLRRLPDAQVHKQAAHARDWH
jgi:hypothetical protein